MKLEIFTLQYGEDMPIENHGHCIFDITDYITYPNMNELNMKPEKNAHLCAGKNVVTLIRDALVHREDIISIMHNTKAKNDTPNHTNILHPRKVTFLLDGVPKSCINTLVARLKKIFNISNDNLNVQCYIRFQSHDLNKRPWALNRPSEVPETYEETEEDMDDCILTANDMNNAFSYWAKSMFECGPSLTRKEMKCLADSVMLCSKIEQFMQDNMMWEHNFLLHTLGGKLTQYFSQRLQDISKNNVMISYNYPNDTVRKIRGGNVRDMEQIVLNTFQTKKTFKK
jgi:hypothetical protein